MPNLNKLKKYWAIYKDNRKPINASLRLAWGAFRLHRKAGWKKAYKIAKGYFMLGLGWSGFDKKSAQSMVSK